jgi:hypothetical protein
LNSITLPTLSQIAMRVVNLLQFPLGNEGFIHEETSKTQVTSGQITVRFKGILQNGIVVEGWGKVHLTDMGLFDDAEMTFSVPALVSEQVKVVVTQERGYLKVTRLEEALTATA